MKRLPYKTTKWHIKLQNGTYLLFFFYWCIIQMDLKNTGQIGGKMKKILIAALIVASVCSMSFAEDELSSVKKTNKSNSSNIIVTRISDDQNHIHSYTRRVTVGPWVVVSSETMFGGIMIIKYERETSGYKYCAGCGYTTGYFSFTEAKTETLKF